MFPAECSVRALAAIDLHATQEYIPEEKLMSVDQNAGCRTAAPDLSATLARRIGGDKPASRYREATFDLQSETNFHYRPLWQPIRAATSAAPRSRWRTGTRSKDPRQFYYGAYVNRQAAGDGREQRSAFVEKHKLMANLPKGLIRRVKAILLPMRHMEWGQHKQLLRMTAHGKCSHHQGTTKFTPWIGWGHAQPGPVANRFAPGRQYR